MGPSRTCWDALRVSQQAEGWYPHLSRTSNLPLGTDFHEMWMENADLHHMDLLRNLPSRVPTPLARTLVAFGFLIAFFAAAAVIHPGSSTARPTNLPEYPLGGQDRQDRPTPIESPSLGTLEGRQFRVEILAGAEPRFNVFDLAGNLIAQNITADELYRIDPLLDISSMTGESAPALMMIEHDIDF